MILIETVVDFLSQYGKVYQQGLEIRMRCPLCGDSKKSKLKKRFSVRYENKLPYSCFNCGRSGTFVELYAELEGVSVPEAFRVLDTPDFEHIKDSFKRTKKKVIEPEKEIDDLSAIEDECIGVDTVTESIILSNYKKVLIKFITDRKIPPEYKIMVSTQGRYKGRIIIPIYDNGKIVYFQGRAISNDMEPKFKNPLVEKSHIIMNHEYFKRDKVIIVTEGIVDAMMVGEHQGTCVLGGSVSDDFLSSILKRTDKGVIIAVDNDERGEIERKKLITSSKFGKLLRFFIPTDPIKDVNELKMKKGIDNMYEWIVSNSLDHWTLSIHQNMF